MNRHPFLPLLTSVLMLVAAQGASAQTLSDADKATLQNAVSRLESAWDIRAPVRIDDGPYVEVSSAGVVTFGGAKLLPALNRSPPEARKGLLTWIAAHEMRHAIQLRDLGGRRANDPAWNRVLECQADLEAARFLAGDLLLELPGKTTDPATLARLKATTFTILAAAESLEGAVTDDDHPPGTLRRLAVSAGQLKAVLDAANTLPLQADEREAIVMQSRKVLDIKEEEAADDWSFRFCQMLLHDGFAKDLVFSTPKPQWNTSGDPPIVDYQISATNAGSSLLSVRMLVHSAGMPRQSLKDVGLLQYVDAKAFEFDLAPGATLSLDGRLIWVATDDVVPRLLRPPNEGSLLMVTRSTPAPEDARIRIRPVLSARLKRLANALELVVNDAPSRFSHIMTDRCDGVADSQSCDVNIAFPFQGDVSIWRESSGAISVHMDLYSGTSKADADAAFDQMRKDLVAIYPDNNLTVKTRSSESRTVEFKPRPRAQLSLHQWKRRIGDAYTVTMEISPYAF